MWPVDPDVVPPGVARNFRMFDVALSAVERWSLLIDAKVYRQFPRMTLAIFVDSRNYTV